MILLLLVVAEEPGRPALNEPATREDRKAARTVCQRVTRAGRNGGDQGNIRIAEPARKIALRFSLPSHDHGL